ncbi:tetratricopeptide repeat protein [Microcoleus sp. Pol11C2]|uniref:tetratricopeptide repeat protein n=1 Tax=Microcoleus sp. Pol11C2 TaxID=3055389 RepID=UPI002FD48729
MINTYFQTANQLKQKGKLLEAIAYYYQAIEANPNFYCSHHNLGEALTKLGRFEEAISSFQQAIDINPDGPCSYYYMAQVLLQTGQSEPANLAYYRAIELNRNWGVLLVKQAGIERVIACFDCVLKPEPHQAMVYYNFSLYLAERDLMDEAIACFQKAPQFSHNQEVNNKGEQEKFPETGEIYEILWKNLNHLGKSDDISETVPTKAEAESYFDKNSHYKIIDMNNLKEADKLSLTNYGLSWANLQIIKKDNLFLEEIYINTFVSTPKVKLSRKFVETVSEVWEPHKNYACSKAIVETGYIYSVCPFSGKILRSNQSFYVYFESGVSMHFYRFVSQEIFYLAIGNTCRGKMCIYLPGKELIIKFSPHWLLGDEIHRIINILKSNLISSYPKTKLYIQSEIPKNLVFDIGFNRNFGHYYWNDLSGILYLQHNNLLEKIENFLVGDKQFFNVGGVFPEIPSHKITQLANNDELFQTILDNNYFAVQVSDLFMSQELADRVTQLSLKKCSENPDFLEKVENAKKHFPLLWIEIRSIRTWVSQVEGNTNMIKKLAKEFPNLGVVIDGWGRHEVEYPLGESMIVAEKDILNEILTLLPFNIPIYSLIGSTTYEKVVFINEVDLYCIPASSGIAKVQWIANKPGVVHAGPVFHGVDWVEEHWSSPLVRENIIPARLVSKEHMVGFPNSDYDCPWSAVYDEVVKIVKALLPR